MSSTVAAGIRQVWINGHLRAEEEACVSPFDHGLLTGDGVFETLVCYEGKLFAFSRHWRRLGRSGEVLGLEIPGFEELRAASNEVVEANGIGFGRLRITVTGGPAPLGSEKGNAGCTVLIAAAPLSQVPRKAKVAVVPYRRNEHGALTGHKTTSYGENVVALAYAKARGASEAIFGNTAGRLCEGTGSNVFLVREGKLITPPLSDGCLPGVTRSLLLELCAREGIAVREESLPLEALAEASEAFLASTTREVQAIEAVDGRALEEAPGAATQQLAQAFRALAESDLDP